MEHAPNAQPECDVGCRVVVWVVVMAGSRDCLGHVIVVGA